jgi:hypothetical protein
VSSQFRAQLEAAYQKKVVDTQTTAVRRTILSVHAELVKNTPVDTGRARSNWWPEINSISVEIREPDNASSSSAQAVSVAQRFKMDDTAYISNNLPYIRRLNDGHSQQAPAGFVEAAVQIGELKAKDGL